MQDLIKQEQFELEVLDRLNSGKFLDKVIFTGGSMLRLCFGLARYSVDLDFWITERIDKEKLFSQLKKYLGRFYTLKDAADKYYTLLFELKSKDFPRSLKIEIRKETREVETEKAIAYSEYSNFQVFMNVVSLKDMMKSKIEAFLQRQEIRDVYDIEFLIKKGIDLGVSLTIQKKILKNVNSLTKKDYKVKLSSLLEAENRKYYLKENFKILKSKIKENIA